MPPNVEATRVIEIRGRPKIVDEAVADLVCALNLMRVDTVGSCEGHLDGIRHPYPWVGTNQFLDLFDDGSVGMLQNLLAIFNEQSEIPWEYTPWGVTPTADILSEFGITPEVRIEFGDSTKTHVVPISANNLTKLHESARALGAFLLTRLRMHSL